MMDSLIELSDLIAQNPSQLNEKLLWICSRCPTTESLLSGSLTVSASHLKAVIAVSRFLSKCPNCDCQRPKTLVLAFFRAIPSSFTPSFWPQSFTIDEISSFFSDYLAYMCKATELAFDFATDVSLYTGGVVTSAISNNSGDLGISRVFLNALCSSFPPILSSDANNLVSYLLDEFVITPGELLSTTSEVTSCHSLPLSVNQRASPRIEANSATNVVWKMGCEGGDALKGAIASFESESLESLEKHDIAFKLIRHILDKATIDSKLLEKVRLIAKEQLESILAFLNIEKRYWSEHCLIFKAKIKTKLSIYQSVANLQIKALESLDLEGKSTKTSLPGTLVLLIKAAEACLQPKWQKWGIFRELFGSLLAGISQAAVTHGGQMLPFLLIHFKSLVMLMCEKADTWGSSQGAMFESVLKTSCEIIEFGWTKYLSPVNNFIMGLASSIRERNDNKMVTLVGFSAGDGEQNQAACAVQLNVIRLLAGLNVSIKKPEVVDMILPLFIEILEASDASTPILLRLQLLDAVSRLASLGFEKSYCEGIVLLIQSYIGELSGVGFAKSRTLASETTTELVETLSAGFVLIASGLTNSKLRSDYRHRLLLLCSDVGFALSKSERSGADFLGPLLPAVAEICSDFYPIIDVEPSLLKLFRNLWFYITLFGLAPPTLKTPTKSLSTTVNSVGSMVGIALQAVSGPYMWSAQWSSAVRRISQGTPPLIVSSVKWLEDEVELNALHNPGNQQGIGNEKAALGQRSALYAALGGRVEVSKMGTISGVRATYLLAVAYLEIIRFSTNGGILIGSVGSTASQSAFSCAFQYLKSPNLMPPVSQCLTAIVHRAFETALVWLNDRASDIGHESEAWEFTLYIHACFLITSLSQRDKHIRDISVNLLSQLRDKFPQILWNSSCLDSLFFPFHSDPPPAVIHDPAWIAFVREWIVISLSRAPCTTQGLLQEKLCKANNCQRTQAPANLFSLLSEIRIGKCKNDCWDGMKTANIPAVMAAAAAASGGNLKLTEAFNLEVLSTGIVGATVKGYHAGEIAGIRWIYEIIGGLDSKPSPIGLRLGLDPEYPDSGVVFQNSCPKGDSFYELLLTRFVCLLQQFVTIAEEGGEVDKSSFRETCFQATALLLSNLGSDSKSERESFSRLLGLLCWSPAAVSSPDAMETGVFVWTWLVSAAPQLGSLVLAEIVDAWLWTIDTKRGLFASETRYSGPAAKLRPHLAAGEPELQLEKDVVQQIVAHRIWLGYFIDRFEVVRHDSVDQLLLLGRMIQGTMKHSWNFSRHPAATGTFFTVMLLGLKFCSCHLLQNLHNYRMGLQQLEDRIYRASLEWFAHEPEWYDMNDNNFSQSEAQSVSIFVQHLLNESVDTTHFDSKERPENGNSRDLEQHHLVWGRIDNLASGRETRKQLLLMLCQHEVDRLQVWAQPISSKNFKESTSHPKISSEKWVEYTRTAFSVDPRIACSMGARFPANTVLSTELALLVQTHILEIRAIPQSLPYFVTPKAVDENSPLLLQLPHWAACSITQALEFLTPAYKGHPHVMTYVLRVLESYPPERVTFFMPQLVQALRYDEGRSVEGYLLRAAQRSNIFAHILIWHLQGEMCVRKSGKDAASAKNSSFQTLLPVVRERIIDDFTAEALDLFEREFDFFDKVMSISGILFLLPKEERRAAIRRELEKIEMEGDDLYLPTATNKLVKGIQVDSGIPLQSAAKVPIMITFNVVDRDADPKDIKPQACIFKVGDDCRQDVLALQVISLLKDIFDAVGLNLYLFPYGVLPTGPERGIIEVVPNTRSRSQMGETTDGGLYEIFQQDHGPVGSPSFEAARENFIISSAGYAVASLLLQPKDRHNGNLLFDDVGRLVHIDFGFILEASPGGNVRFESAHFKLSHEMTQLIDPSGAMKSETWYRFVSLCVKGYLAARRHMDGILNTILLMLDSGLPCFSMGDPIGNLRKRFHPEMSEREAANFMIRTCTDAYNKWITAGYDLIQYLQQGIEK